MESKDPCRVSDAGHPFRVPLLDTRRIPAVRKCRALCRVGILRLRKCRACAATHFAQDDRRAKTSDAICGTLMTERWVTSRRLAVCFRVYGDDGCGGGAAEARGALSADESLLAQNSCQYKQKSPRLARAARSGGPSYSSWH